MSIATLAIPVFCSLISEPWDPRNKRQIAIALIDRNDGTHNKAHEFRSGGEEARDHKLSLT